MPFLYEKNICISIKIWKELNKRDKRYTIGFSYSWTMLVQVQDQLITQDYFPEFSKIFVT